MINMQETFFNSTIFSSLSKRERKRLTKEAVIKDFLSGETVYTQGSNPENIYIIISGMIETSVYDSHIGTGKVIETLFRGTCFGILSAMTNSSHSVTAVARRYTQLMIINNNILKKILHCNKTFYNDMAHLLSRRVAARTGTIKSVFSNTILTVAAVKEKIGASELAEKIAAVYMDQTENKHCIILEFVPINADSDFFDLSKDPVETWPLKLNNSRGYDRLSVTPSERPVADQISGLVSALSQNYNFIIIDINSQLRDYDRLCFCISDYVFVLTEDDFTIDEHLYEQSSEVYAQQIYLISRKKQEDYIIKRFKGPQDTANLAFDITENTTDKLKRTVRRMAQVRTGLALGSGGSLALSHLGVLEILERKNIEIDLVAGTSMGSLIAALWCLGRSPQQIKDILMNQKDVNVFTLKNISLSGKSILNSKRMQRVIRRILGEAAFADLIRPLRIVCFDYYHRSPYYFGTDHSVRLADAVLASCSFPGIFPPVIQDGRKLFDGGILEPLPVDVLIYNGIQKIIASSVTPTADDVYRGFQKTGINTKANILDHIFGCIEAMHNDFISRSQKISDIFIHPQVYDVNWTDFSRIEYCIEQGKEAAARAFSDKSA